jgi:hypothetical protein
MLLIMLLVSLLCNIFEMIDSSHNYQVQNEVDVKPNVDSSWIISNIRKENHIF